MRIDSISTTNNSAIVTMYDGDDVPGGENFAPSAASRTIRWGNQKDKERQQVFFISSVDGRFLFLQGVDKPIIDDNQYSAWIGCPPEMDILKGLPINKKQPYIYARGLIVQDLIRIDYKGQPEYTFRDLGTWDSTHLYIHGPENDNDGNLIGYFTDRVWWGGCYWQCAAAQATTGHEPRYNNADWMCLIGNGDITMEITSSAGNFFRNNQYFETTLSAEVKHAEMVISEGEIGFDNITWTRHSDDEAGDVAWNAKHLPGKCGLSININFTEDIPINWGKGGVVTFQCEAQIDKEKLIALYEL